MEKEDHLDKETSVSFDLTETGGGLKAKSRFISAIDRLGGSLVEIISFPAERRVQRSRLELDTEIKVAEEAAKKLVQAVRADCALANRVLEASFKKEARKQLNKDGVIGYALEDLRNASPEISENAESPEELSEEFLERFERYAEDASSEQLRERWGRVLAGEVRKPGTFSRKVLRAIDELEPETAKLFERVAEFALGGSLPICLTGVLSFDEQAILISSGLVLDPGLGHWRVYNKVPTSTGEHWFCNLGEYAVSFPISTEVINPSDNEVSALRKHGEKFAFQIYALTDIGNALETIIQKQTLSAVEKYIAKLLKHVPPASIIPYRLDRAGSVWIKMGTAEYFAEWPNTSPQPG